MVEETVAPPSLPPLQRNNSFPLKDNNNLINKSVHASDGVILGNIHAIDKHSITVKRDMISTVYYHIPIGKAVHWDGHALWLNIDDKESKKHILPRTDREEDSSATPMDFDIDGNILGQMNAKAEEYGLSLNMYLNQIIKRYLEWDRFEPKAGIVPISKPVVQNLFDNLTKEEIIDIAKGVGKDAVENIAAKLMKDVDRNLDLNSFLQWLEAEMNSYAIEIRHIVTTCPNHNNSNSLHRYILKHDAGENFSLYYRTVLDLIFRDVLQKRIDIKTTTNSLLTFEF